jgi:gamma-glutamylputrescine oxidase
MKNTIQSQDQVFWYLKRSAANVLREDVHADVAIIGGGMAGLTAAQAFLKKGKKVILLEAFYCGAGASGKSSGFITPNGELGISDFTHLFGKQAACTIWKRITSGMQHIKDNIDQYALDCEYMKQDSLYVASKQRDVKRLMGEHTALQEFGYASRYMQKNELQAVLGAHGYYGGITYPDTFGINAYAYCQAMKDILIQQGVAICEETPVLAVHQQSIDTLHAKVTADRIVVCADRFMPTLSMLKQQIYHVQTFILMSQPLTDAQIQMIFPHNNYMVWDTELVYNYYRLHGNRLLLGGGSVLNTYNTYETHNSRYMYNKLTRYFKKKFPQLTLQFEHIWPGLIGISKDIAPIMGADKENSSIYYIGAAAGLPVAASLALYAADHIVDGADDLKNYFSPYRAFPIGGVAQSLMGDKLSFAVSNVLKMDLI